MQDQKSIRVFYLTNLISSALGGIGGMAMLALLSQKDYGLYTLFSTFVLQFAILSFGYPDGLLIDYREANGKPNLKALDLDLKYITKFQLGVILIALALFNLSYLVFHFDIMMLIIINMAIVVMFPALIVENLRSIFISLKDFKNISKIDAFNKSYLVFLMIPLLIFYNSPHLIIIYMISEFILRLGFCYYMCHCFLKKYSSQIKNSEAPNHIPKSHFKKGIYLLLGNWLVVLIYSLDKMFLSSNKEDLGIYTQGLFFFGIIYQLVMPFKDVIFVKINTRIKDGEIFRLAIILMLGLFILVGVFSYVVIPGAIYLCNLITTNPIYDIGATRSIANKFLEYQNALEISKATIVLVPTYITVQLVLDNLLMIKMQSRYAKKTAINFFIVLLIFIVCQNTITSNLVAVVTATIINSIFLFVSNLYSVTNLKLAFYGLIAISGVISLYFLGLSQWYLQLIVILIYVTCFIYMKKKLDINQFSREDS